MDPFSHRLAKREDLRAIVEIYNSTVASRLVTADTEPVSVESRRSWFDAHRPGTRPLWVAELDGRIAGWLSFSSFYGRPAYDRTAELSLYVHASFRKRGLGSYLLAQAIGHAPAIGADTLLGFRARLGVLWPKMNRSSVSARWAGVTRGPGVVCVQRQLGVIGPAART